jgi:HlyD family secretion protein
MEAVAAPPPSWRSYGYAGYALILFTFGILGGGACVVRIDSALVAPATVTVESNRTVVAHLEGGIIDDVLVHEGDRVVTGQRLFRLSDVGARANVTLLESQLAADLSLEARLTAERDQTPGIAWPAELAALPVQAQVAQAMNDQAAQFRDRRRSLDGQAAILRNRISQLRLEIQGMGIEKDSTGTQLGFIKTELTGVTDLFKQKLVEVARLLALQREQAKLEGTVGRLITDQARSERAVAETELQIQQLQQHFQEQVSTELTDTRRQIGDVRDKLAIAQDILTRIYIVAPVAGSVQALRVGGGGQVIRQGEPLLEIVPDHDRLQINAQFQPTDVSDLRRGQTAEVRFPAFPSRGTPLILGRVESVSGDRLVDEVTHLPYFLGIISVDPANLPPEFANRLRPGMPAEVVVPTGERTVMSYLTQPLSRGLRRTFVEK